jgi:hypothetical protein
MKRILQCIVAASSIIVVASAGAQFVKGNEAIAKTANGSRKVETPPLPAASLAAPCLATNPGCSAGGWLMVEISEGLRECTEIYARPGTCRSSTYGSEKLSRLWIVKLKGQWMQCQFPDIGSKCVSTKALPFSAVQ